MTHASPFAPVPEGPVPGGPVPGGPAPGGPAPGGPALPGARAGRDPARAIKRGPSRLPPEVVAATQRDRLFDGLVQTVAEKGYASARVSDICQAAGVTRPVFYEQFPGKDEAFLAAYRYGTRELIRLMSEAFESAGDWCGGIRAGIRALLGVLAAVPAFATMAIVEIDAVGPAARAERAQMLSRFRPFFELAPDQPEPPGDGPDELLGLVIGGIYATVYRYVAAGRVADLPGLAPALTYFALVPFVGRQEARRQASRAALSRKPGLDPCATRR